ncbi:signalosome subunit protein [Rutstroemia sp. NJR-2017a WRK4]|nr:signalosome subunit protein [Rutstroemia sp. NJR-2017a WRK4]
MAVDTQNPLLSTQKSSDSGLQVALHPLVLLTISDYITRHTLRQQTGPVVGALLGQQNGREITIEHAFECLLQESEEGVILAPEWFESRLQQMRDVHKSPALDLVGWYTILPNSGPQPHNLPIHRQILLHYNESAILLGFHPEEVAAGSVGGKLPLTIYESNYEAEVSSADAGEDKEMTDAESLLKLKFKELPYTVETGEAEMISVDFVARGGGNATAVESTSKKAPSTSAPEDKGKGKGKATTKSEEGETSKSDDKHILSREDEEQLASLTAKANAIKMLHSRINLITVYLQNLPPSYISDGVTSSADAESKKYTPVNQSILRSIQALLSRLSVLIPADSIGFEHELMSEKNDVTLISLLGELTKSVQEVRETGKKFSIVESGKSSRAKREGGMSWTDSGHPMHQVMTAGDLMG